MVGHPPGFKTVGGKAIGLAAIGFELLAAERGEAAEVGGHRTAFGVIPHLVEGQIEDVLLPVQEAGGGDVTSHGAEQLAQQAVDAGTGEAEILAVLHAEAGVAQHPPEDGGPREKPSFVRIAAKARASASLRMRCSLSSIAETSSDAGLSYIKSPVLLRARWALLFFDN